MDFYQQLQLSSIGSKQWIKGAKDSKEKHKRILIYNFKVYLVVAFCYSMIFGSQNSVVGVLVLLVLMILRQVDFGIDTKHSIGVIFMIFAILAIGPRLANTVNTVPAFFIHFLYARLQKDFLSNLHQFCKWITYRLPFEPETHLVRSQHRKCFRFLAI